MYPLQWGILGFVLYIVDVKGILGGPGGSSLQVVEWETLGVND